MNITFRNYYIVGRILVIEIKNKPSMMSLPPPPPKQINKAPIVRGIPPHVSSMKRLTTYKTKSERVWVTCLPRLLFSQACTIIWINFFNLCHFSNYYYFFLFLKHIWYFPQDWKYIISLVFFFNPIVLNPCRYLENTKKCQLDKLQSSLHIVFLVDLMGSMDI